MKMLGRNLRAKLAELMELRLDITWVDRQGEGAVISRHPGGQMYLWIGGDAPVALECCEELTRGQASAVVEAARDVSGTVDWEDVLTDYRLVERAW